MTVAREEGVGRGTRPERVPAARWGGVRYAGLLAGAALILALAGCGGGNAKPTATPVRNDALAVVTPTPGTPVPRTPTPPVAREHYVVQEGDTLSSIAQKFGVSQDLLQRANNISDPNSIYVGQTLNIP